jgi:hypothetical protein
MLGRVAVGDGDATACKPYLYCLWIGGAGPYPAVLFNEIYDSLARQLGIEYRYRRVQERPAPSV